MFKLAEKKCECVIGAEVILNVRQVEQKQNKTKTHELRAVGKCMVNVKLLLTADAWGDVWRCNGTPVNKCKPSADCRHPW